MGGFSSFIQDQNPSSISIPNGRPLQKLDRQGSVRILKVKRKTIFGGGAKKSQFDVSLKGTELDILVPMMVPDEEADEKADSKPRRNKPRRSTHSIKPEDLLLEDDENFDYGQNLVGSG